MIDLGAAPVRSSAAGDRIYGQMTTKVDAVRIAGIAGAVPRRSVTYMKRGGVAAEVPAPEAAEILRMTGVRTRHVGGRPFVPPIWRMRRRKDFLGSYGGIVPRLTLYSS